MPDTRWINIMTNFMIKVLKVDKKFEETIRKFITDHVKDFRTKYKNTLALNNETRFKELENCRNENELEKKLYEITTFEKILSEKNNANPENKSSHELLITDARNSEVIKFKKQRSEIRDKVKKLICEIMSIALTGKPNEKVELDDLYQNNSNIPLKKFLPPENTSLSVDMLKEALKIELGGFEYNKIRLHYLWKEVLMIIGDMLDAVTDAKGKDKRMGLIQKKLKSFEVDMFGEKWKPLTEKEISNLDYKIQKGAITRGQKLESDKLNHNPDEKSLNSVKGKQIKDNSNWAKIMTNFMITILKVNKNFAGTIEEFFTTNAKELKKPGKYPNTLALNKEPRFIELRDCKTTKEVEKKLREITKL